MPLHHAQPFRLKQGYNIRMVLARQKIVRGHTVPPRNTRGRREGFTTGTAAAAATKAACMILIGQPWPEKVTIHLPIGRDLEIPINTLEWTGQEAIAGVVKDAGDDPDVTHGAEIFSTARRSSAPGIAILGGVGVGQVTKRGLELPIGSPAINPVPQQMIRQAAEEVLSSTSIRSVSEGNAARSASKGLSITISVPNGEELARRTFNPRIGIIGGISILGTTGIVRAMSTASWRASVIQQIDVAAANGIEHIILSTGGRTEKFAQKLYPDLPELAFIEMGIFTGDALKQAAKHGIPRVSLCCMIGKLSKIAQGKMQTHVAGNQVDCGFLAQIAQELNAPCDLVASIRQANTARHVQELVDEARFGQFYSRLCELTAEQCAAVIAGKLQVDVVLFDFDGRILGQTQR